MLPKAQTPNQSMSTALQRNTYVPLFQVIIGDAEENFEIFAREKLALYFKVRRFKSVVLYMQHIEMKLKNYT